MTDSFYCSRFAVPAKRGYGHRTLPAVVDFHRIPLKNGASIVRTKQRGKLVETSVEFECDESETGASSYQPIQISSIVFTNRLRSQNEWFWLRNFSKFDFVAFGQMTSGYLF